MSCYWIVTRITAARDPAVLWRTATFIDAWIPHLAWTWPLYWAAYPFVAIGGCVALMRVGPMAFRRAIAALAGMTIVGALVQLTFPARAPWPPDPGQMQLYLHQSALVMPYATLPSMHVAYAAVIAGLLGSAFPGRTVRLGGLLVVLLIAVSTLTLKEHELLDVLSGGALALATLRWWRGAA